MKTKEKNRNGLQVMAGLIGMVRPLLAIMFFAVFLGCAGNLMASFITILGVYAVLCALNIYNGTSLVLLIALMIVFAVLRGSFRYGEQASNHYIAFKLLARIRHKVFTSLRRLAPAKLDGSEKGNLISLITSDIELLEVFYAHTISPIAIAVITSVFMVIFIGVLHPAAGALAAVFYLIVGLAIPVLNGRRGSKSGQEYRNLLGNLNTVVLDNLYGLKEILQFGQRKARLSHMEQCTDRLEKTLHVLKKNENISRIVTDWVILAAGIGMAVLCVFLTDRGLMDQSSGVIAVAAMMSSFGPTAALSSLSNNLSHTLASGNRVLNLLEEEPVTRDVVGKSSDCGGDIFCQHLYFSYENIDGSSAGVLQDFSAVFNKKRIHGILGKSGCGKSTLLKLLMHFYETQQGKICYGQTNINDINTDALRRHISYVTQDTFLFHDTIENNIKIGHPDASRAMVIEAAKKASVHDFIMSLPQGYETKLSELGDCVSGGERQRIGIARAFLHNSDVIVLDEPTSNIDSLNEGIILKSLNDVKKDKMIILVSHRASTMGIADHVIKMDNSYI